MRKPTPEEQEDKYQVSSRQKNSTATNVDNDEQKITPVYFV
ncbi:hypothetical protein [Photorhabdus bodei]|uniref:Uncharacterized protein n=1 Tax=Photorhabdus bodei TaxID=2029681 RepID=A0AAW6BMJ6_9GAMM|nr:hypothetical protein [Photorhabdus bodei]MDB6373893.1 hypothetical protein [Photorhabdus bodei]